MQTAANKRLFVTTEPPSSRQRVLWRMQGPSRIVAATIRAHQVGHELVVFFEDDENDIIETQLDTSDVHGLEERATALRLVLESKGWTPLPEPENVARVGDGVLDASSVG